MTKMMDRVEIADKSITLSSNSKICCDQSGIVYQLSLGQAAGGQKPKEKKNTKRFEIDLDGGKKAYLSGDFFILETHKSTVKVLETTKKDFANCDFED